MNLSPCADASCFINVVIILETLTTMNWQRTVEDVSLSTCREYFKNGKIKNGSISNQNTSPSHTSHTTAPRPSLLLKCRAISGAVWSCGCSQCKVLVSPQVSEPTPTSPICSASSSHTGLFVVSMAAGAVTPSSTGFCCWLTVLKTLQSACLLVPSEKHCWQDTNHWATKLENTVFSITLV